jgi:hypothetical protein
MSVLLLAISTTRARAVSSTAEFLTARGVEVVLVTVDPAAWRAEDLPEGVRIIGLGEGEQRHPLARLGRMMPGPANKIYAKVYRLLRPYVMWRVARRSAVRQIDFSAVQQLVICDSHAIPIGWHLAKRHPTLPVGFELDRVPFQDREPALAPTASPSPIRPAGIDVDA